MPLSLARGVEVETVCIGHVSNKKHCSRLLAVLFTSLCGRLSMSFQSLSGAKIWIFLQSRAHSRLPSKRRLSWLSVLPQFDPSCFFRVRPNYWCGRKYHGCTNNFPKILWAVQYLHGDSFMQRSLRMFAGIFYAQTVQVYPGLSGYVVLCLRSFRSLATCFYWRDLFYAKVCNLAMALACEVYATYLMLKLNFKNAFNSADRSSFWLLKM